MELFGLLLWIFFERTAGWLLGCRVLEQFHGWSIQPLFPKLLLIRFFLFCVQFRHHWPFFLCSRDSFKIIITRIDNKLESDSAKMSPGITNQTHVSTH